MQRRCAVKCCFHGSLACILFSARTSAWAPEGGARPKAAVSLADERLAMAKFPKPDDTRDISAGEILALTLAAQAGIQVAEHQRMAVGKQSVAVITRFDRVGKTRVPFISASSLLGLPQGEPGAYTLLADSIRQFGDDVQADLRELWRRLVFSLLASNYDDHLRNHGFLMRAPGRWLLVLGIGVGLWYLTILVMVLRSPRLHGGALPSIILAVIGVLTIGGCINRLMKRIPKQP